MAELSSTRIKCAMVIYELERELGRLNRERSETIPGATVTGEILARVGVPPSSSADGIARHVIENSYLAEVISLAAHSTKGTSASRWVEQLTRLVESLSIYEIRNAVSHPNRPFPDFYWYRCAAIASDPSIDGLALFNVALAFQNALEGKIQEPPEDWLFRLRWSVPAILPAEFEHSVTGLVGRSKDALKLERELTNARAPLIAVVARGGVGKTSLALQVVSDFCLSAKSAVVFDGVIWSTLKQEMLTAKGIEILSAPNSMEELQSSLLASINHLYGLNADSFDEAKSAASEKRLLLCLDNLETIIRDHASSFQEFNESLPGSWKVLVTSRIPVEGAKNLPLDVLDGVGAAALTRAYYAAKGLPAPTQELVDRIVLGCKCNPLAIRLTVDLYLAGKEIAGALQKTEQEVLAFSFTSLLETLSAIQNDCLEAIFVMEQPTRMQICASLGASPDEVADAVAKLSAMSLLTRGESESGERYSLGSSIRDLLRAYPRGLAVRSRIAAWLAKSRSVEENAFRQQQERNVPEMAFEFIPPDTSSQYIALCRRIPTAVKAETRHQLVSLESEIRHHVGQDPASSFLHRLYGWILISLDDPATGVTHFQRAHALSENDPSAMYGLAMALNAQGKWPELLRTATDLIDKGWGEPEKSGAFYANRIWTFLLKSANFGEDVEAVFGRTVNWADRTSELPSLAVGRASAYRRLADMEYRQGNSTPERLGSLLSKASRPLTSVIEIHGFARWFSAEISKLVGEFSHYHLQGVAFDSFEREDRAAVSGFLGLCFRNDSLLVVSGLSREILERARQFITPQRDAVALEARRIKFIVEGYTIATVKNGVKPRYFFARDEAQVDYYVKIDLFEKNQSLNYSRLVPGALVALKAVSSPTVNTMQATEAWLLA